MKKIILFARDPGGANVIAPLYEKLKNKYEVIVFGKEFALDRLDSCIDIKTVCETITQENIIHFIQKQKPDFVITGTSLNDYTERYLWKACDILHVKSFAIMDQWMNMGVRFSQYSYDNIEKYNKEKKHPFLPYRILVMDEIAKKMLMEEGVKDEKILVSGQPHFDTIYHKYKTSTQIYDHEKINIAYISEPISQDYDNSQEDIFYWGFNEKTIFRNLLECLRSLSSELKVKIRLIIRPHPREDKEYWKSIINTELEENITIVLDEKNNSFDIIKSMDIICGISSMFLLEAAICKKTIVSIGIGLRRENPFILHRLDYIHTQETELELNQTLRNILKEGVKPIQFDYIKDAGDKVVEYIEKEIRYGYTCS